MVTPACDRDWARWTGAGSHDGETRPHPMALDSLVVYFADLTLDAGRSWAVGLAVGRRPATVANRVRALKVLSHWCEDEGYLAADPLARLRRPAVPRTIIATFNDDQVRAMLEAAPPPLAMTLRILLDTGLHISEAVGMACDDVLGGPLRVTGKGGDERVVPIGQTLDAALRRYRDRGRPGPRGKGGRAAPAVEVGATADRPLGLLRDAPSCGGGRRRRRAGLAAHLPAHVRHHVPAQRRQPPRAPADPRPPGPRHGPPVCGTRGRRPGGGAGHGVAPRRLGPHETPASRDVALSTGIAAMTEVGSCRRAGRVRGGLEVVERGVWSGVPSGLTHLELGSVVA